MIFSKHKIYKIHAGINVLKIYCTINVVGDPITYRVLILFTQIVQIGTYLKKYTTIAKLLTNFYIPVLTTKLI